MARTGLRMMPTFPLPPLKFRTAGFPQYGFKAGLSEGAFPKEAPNCRAHLVCFPPSRSSLSTCMSPLCVGEGVRLSAAIRATLMALPQGSSLRTGLCCPGSSTLNRPHPPQLRAHPNFAALRLIRDAFAVHVPSMPRRPTTGSELSLMLFRNMSSSETTGNFPVALTQYFAGDSSLDLGITVSAFPSSSHSDSGEVCVFEA